MITVKRATQGPSVTVYLKPNKFTEEAIKDAMEMAQIWEEEKVVTHIDWDSPYMEANNELANFSFRINCINREKYDENWRDFLGLSYETFSRNLLACIVSFLGRWALPSLQGLVRDSCKFALKDLKEYMTWVQNGGLEQPRLFHDLLLLLPATDDNRGFLEYLADMIDIGGSMTSSKKRDLPDISSFFLFEFFLDSHLSSENVAQKCLFYPVRLWKQISMVIPLRPIEFLVTPYDCLQRSEAGEWFLTLRRNRIKGKNKIKGYKIDKDFELVTYQVPEDLANQIQEYKDFAAKEMAKPSALGTLFSPELHYKGLGRTMPEEAVYYTYQNLSYALQAFQEDIIEGEYQYKVIFDRSQSLAPHQENTIYRILPGDSRHLSLLNAAQEGVPPQTLKEIVRHSTIPPTYWYAANDTILQNCSTTQAYMENLRRTTPVPYVPLPGYYDIKEGAPFTELDKGRCYSPFFNNKSCPDVIGCIQYTGPLGETGWCPACPYYRTNGGNDQFDPGKFALDAETDWKLLLSTIDQYRMDILHEDSLINAFERARSSINILKDLLERDVMEAEKKRGENAKKDV